MIIHFLNTREDKTTLSYFARDTCSKNRPGIGGSEAYRGGPGKIKINEIC